MRRFWPGLSLSIREALKNLRYVPPRLPFDLAYLVDEATASFPWRFTTESSHQA
jgi:hypothetical protein